MKPAVTVPLERLTEEQYASVLCYPQPTEAELLSRLEELKNHNVTALEFSGTISLHGVRFPVLGKGFVGVVVVAYLKGERVAVKIRRTDADRTDLLHEANMLTKANNVNVGPRLISSSKNFLLMQLIDGETLPNWLKTHKEKTEVQTVLKAMLEQCFRLDGIGLDHGELSKAPKHIMVDRTQTPWILDFETASEQRNPANLPALCHFLFTSKGEVSQAISLVLGEKDRQAIVKALQSYKRCRSKESLDLVLRTCLN